jgi:GntR family transcriptional regulator/MocR family aminotransferase
MLVSDDLVKSIPGSGFYVKQIPSLYTTVQEVDDYKVPSLYDDELTEDVINFDSGIPALDLFPRKKFNRLVSQAFLDCPPSALGYDLPQGRAELREVLCEYLKKTRGIMCHSEQIIITTGAKQALSLIAKCLLNQNSEVWLEDPSNDNVRKIFAYHTNKIRPLAVDGQGLQTQSLPKDSTPAFIFTTPSHQFPMGGILSVQRRLDLINFAKKTGCYIVEDDYDSEFRYDGIPTHSLCELDNQHVIYIGTFSKIMFPSLRLGYIVLPTCLVNECKELKRLGDHHTNSVYQLALMHFIESGELERHIHRMKKIYYKRRNYLIELLEKYFSKHVKIYGEAAGMHIVAEFDTIEFSKELISQIRQAGVYIVPVEKHAIEKGSHANQIILGYAQLNEEEIKRGLLIIKKIFETTSQVIQNKST